MLVVLLKYERIKKISITIASMQELLIRAGLSLREVKVYTALLHEGELMASQIAKKTDLIRTNTYDVLHALIKKGIVSYVIRNGKKYFRPAEPEKLLDFMSEQQKDLEETKETLVASLQKFKPVLHDTTRPIIEVYEGKEGLKTILELSVRESRKMKNEILGISVQQQQCRDLAGLYHVRWYKEREKYKLKSRYLMSAQEAIIPVKYTQFKILPKSAQNPDEIFIFGNITTQFFFTGKLFTAIVIKNKEITQKYRDYFEFLWQSVKRVT